MNSIYTYSTFLPLIWIGGGVFRCVSMCYKVLAYMGFSFTDQPFVDRYGFVYVCQV